MKTLLIITAILFSFFFGEAKVAEKADSVQTCFMPVDIKKALALKMHFPPEAREFNVEGIVTTCFYITPDGKVKVYCINGHPLLSSYVKKRLESFECCPPSASVANKHMIVRFNFDIEDI